MRLLTEIRTVMWKELRELRWMLGETRLGWLGLFLPLLYIGIAIPLQVGPLWLSPPLVLIFAFLMPVMLPLMITADSFAGERERKTLEALLSTCLSDRSILYGKILTGVVYAWLACQAMFLLGLITLNARQLVRGEEWLFFDWRLTLAALLLPLVSAFSATAAGVLVSLRAGSVRQAQQTLGLSVAALFFLPGLLFPLLPKVLAKEQLDAVKAYLKSAGWGMLAGVFFGAVLLAGLLAVLVSRRLFRRARMILD